MNLRKSYAKSIDYTSIGKKLYRIKEPGHIYTFFFSEKYNNKIVEYYITKLNVLQEKLYSKDRYPTLMTFNLRGNIVTTFNDPNILKDMVILKSKDLYIPIKRGGLKLV